MVDFLGLQKGLIGQSAAWILDFHILKGDGKDSRKGRQKSKICWFWDGNVSISKRLFCIPVSEL